MNNSKHLKRNDAPGPNFLRLFVKNLKRNPLGKSLKLQSLGEMRKSEQVAQGSILYATIFREARVDGQCTSMSLRAQQNLENVFTCMISFHEAYKLKE